MDHFERMQTPMTTSRSMLSASSRKKRDAIVALEMCIQHGGLPKALRSRAEESVKAMMKQLRMKGRAPSEDQQENSATGQAQKEKQEVVDVLNQALTGSIPKWARSRIERSVRDLQFNLTFSAAQAASLHPNAKRSTPSP